MRYRTALGALLVLLAGLLIVTGCQVQPQPQTPTLAPTPVSTAEQPPVLPSLTPLATAEVSPQYIPSTGPGVVPILYKMFDWGTDFQKEHPEWGPVGSVQFVLWETINPGPDQYNWEAIDRQLAKEAPLRVTLPDGREIPKPVVIQVMAHISSYPGWDAAEYYDGTPQWVYARIEAAGQTVPRVGGRRVGHVLKGCDRQAVLPRYDSPIWREAYHKMIRAFGERYNNNPQVTSIVINTGLDGETQPVKDLYCTWNKFLDTQAADVRYNFGKFIEEAMAVHRDAFPDKVIYINHAPAGSGGRKAIADKAATFNPPIGLKHAGMWVDLDSHQGYGNFVGSWDMVRAYSMTLPIWLESPFGLGDKEQRYWSLIAGLHYHPDAIDLHPEFFTQSEPEWLDFTVRHLGVTIDNTPSVWTVLRDSEYPLQDWGKGGVSGHMGDWTFWLNRTETSGQSATAVVQRKQMPAAKDHVFSRQARKTQQSKNQLYMDFDVQDTYPFVNQQPLDDGGDAYFRVHVTLLNIGGDTFALQYRDAKGDLVSQVRTKGPSLGPEGDWVRVTFTVTDGFWNDNMPGENDFRLSCEGDGDEYVHMVEVQGGFGRPPTLTPTPLATGTPRQTATASSTPRPESGLPRPVGTPTPLSGAVRFDPVADTVLDEWSPGTNAGAADKLSVRQGDIKVPLVAFDLAAIPQGAHIDKALLSMYVLGRSNSAAMYLAAYKLLRPWDAAEANWTRASAGVSWAVPGCKDPQRDRSSVAVARLLLQLDRGWHDLDVTDLVRDWVSDGSPNEGLLLAGSGSTSVQYDFASADYYDGNLRPRLWVVYRQPGSPTPTVQSGPTATTAPAPLPTPTTIRLREGDDYMGVSDTYLDAWAQDRNYGRDYKMSARQGSVKVPLLRFDLALIPSHASVKRAVLHLYATSRSNPSPLRLSVAQVSRFWDPNQVTWMKTTASEAWAQPGARDAASDRSREIYASALVDSERRWTEWDITELVQQWVADPQGNHGLLMLAEGSVSVQYDFSTSQWYPEDYRPYLEVEFVALSPSPTITSSPEPYPVETLSPAPTQTEALPVQPSPTLTKDGDVVRVRELVLQKGLGGYEGVYDTYLDAWSQTTNAGDQSALLVRQPNVRSALLRYDLSSIPHDAVVREAKLNLWVAESSGQGAMCLQVYMMRRPWQESAATWIEADTGVGWAAGGAGAAGTDYQLALVDAVTLESPQQWAAFDIAAAVQYWVQHPEANYGLLIKGVGSDGIEYLLSSSQWETRQQRPKILASYEIRPAQSQSALPGSTDNANSLRWLGILTAVAAAVLLLVAAGIPSKAKPPR